ncbi:MAG: WbqC family protein [Bacteroidales bacterium]|nr:WbqC family protein [Bacteroidales bacterium]
MTTAGSALLSTAYLGPVQYFTKFLLFPEIIIEQHENYSKQTYRNRCCIYGANGKMELVIPVIHGQGKKIKIRDVQIEYTTPWQHIHWKSIQSAYHRSPFFEYYEDELYRSFFHKEKFLVDFNTKLLNILLSLLGISKEIHKSESYLFPSAGFMDYRTGIHPKQAKQLPDDLFKVIEYNQVFSDRYGFLPNLSIIDLLFNLGPESELFLKNSIK